MRHLEIFEDDSILEYEEIQLLNMGRNMLIVYHHHHHQLTLRMVPKKSSTNFWTVPFVDSNRVRKISGMDLGEDVKTIIIIIIIVIFVIVIIIIIVIKNMVLTCASEALRLRLSFEDDPASPSGTFERHHPDHYHDGDEDDEAYGDDDNNDDDDDDDHGKKTSQRDVARWRL